jgi:hypothetical protein
VKGLPSQVVPRIVEARKEAGCSENRLPYAGPVELLGPREYEWGAPYRARDEFADFGLPLDVGNEDPVAGMLRIAELLRPDQEHRFAEWHGRVGEMGSPRLFVSASCRRLVEQLSSAPLAADGERLARAAVQPDWELHDGGLVAALRYAVMSRPSPSVKPPEWIEDPRRRRILEAIREDDEDLERMTRRGYLDTSGWMG